VPHLYRALIKQRNAQHFVEQNTDSLRTQRGTSTGKQGPSLEADNRSGSQEIPADFMKCSREATMGPCSEPDESGSHHQELLTRRDLSE
jgi:hypothetical protein